jgi:hypothetical protein
MRSTVQKQKEMEYCNGFISSSAAIIDLFSSFHWLILPSLSMAWPAEDGE